MRGFEIAPRRAVRGPVVRLRGFFVTACLLVASSVVPGPLFAQTQSGQQTDAAIAFAKVAADSSGTPRDSTQATADSVARVASSKARLDSLKTVAEAEAAVAEEQASFGPVKYTTGYTLNRTTSNWDQNLNLEFSARGISVNTRATGTLYSDTETKNDRRNSTSSLGIGYAASKRLSLGLDLSLSRINDNFLNKRYNTNQVSARAAYTLPHLDRLSASLTARAGKVDEIKPTYTGSGTTSGLTLDSKYAFALPCTLQVNASGEFTNRRSQGARTALKTKDKDVKELVNASLGVVPFKNTKLRFGLSNSNSRLQYPFLGRQETWVSKSTVMDASLDLTTIKGITLLATGKYKDNDISYDVDRIRSSTFLSKTLSTVLTVPALLGTTLTSNFDLEYANNVMGSGRNGDVNTKGLSGRISRGLTPLITSEVMGSVSLVQYFFYDPGSIGDGRDIYKDAVSVGVTLGASGSPYSGSATIKRDLEKMVYVRSINSGNNRTSELYSAMGSFVYRRGKLTFMQNASTTMDYSLFHFNRNQNILSRTTSISSSLDFPWAERAAFNLTHVYRIQDSGSFTIPEGDDHEVYQRTGGSITQELYLVSEYKFTNDVSVSVGQRFQQSRSFSFGNGRRTFSVPRKVLDLLEDFRLAYQLGKDSNVQMTLSRTTSAFGTSYWNATATFSTDFF